MVLRSVVVAALAIVALGGCADEGSAVRVKLVADPTINSEAQVLAVIDELRLVFDRAGGFQPAPGFQIADVDADGEGELIYAEPVTDERAFPLLRLRAGTVAGPFVVAAKGLVGGQLAATGAPASIDFEAEDNAEVTLALDLRAKYRPPRVEVTLPQDGQDPVPAALGTIYVVFSKWIAHASTPGQLALIYRGAGNAEQTVAGRWSLEDSSVMEGGLPEERTTATLQLSGSCTLAAGKYTIDVRTGISDVAGVALDQRAESPGPDGYAASFTLPGAPADEPCGATPTPGCAEDADCDPAMPPRFICADKERGDGRCVPTPQSCDGPVSCPSGYRCVEATAAALVTCVREAQCQVDADCDDADPPRILCGEEGEDQGRCIPAPPNCSMVVCPEGYRCDPDGAGGPVRCLRQLSGCALEGPGFCGLTAWCNEFSGECVPCEIYPSGGCVIECTELTQERCPDGTSCDFELNLCRS